MNEDRASTRRFIDRLGFRLGLVLSMALLPIGLLAVLQARSLMNEARARSEAALEGETLRVLLPELRLIRQGQGASEVLASVVPILLRPGAADRAACEQIMRDTVETSNIYAYAAFVSVGGTITCASDDRAEIPVDLDRVAALAPEEGTKLMPAHTEGSGLPSGLAAVHPVTGGDGALLGYTLINMPHARLSQAAATMTTRKDNFALVLFDEEGRILASNSGRGEPMALLPGEQPLVTLTDATSRTFTAPDTSGQARSFSVIKLSDVNIFALGSWPAAGDPMTFIRTIPAIAFPLLMWAVCLVAAWLAAENLVTRYIRRLRRAITHFARGNREVLKLDMAGAPLEIREVSEAFERMTETILHDEAELENSLHQKEVLLREVHHRVKNNLQLIASIMSMQMRKTKSAEAKSLMKGLQDRVMSLATIHKGLYQTTGQADIRAEELFPEIVHQVIRMASGPGKRFEAKTAFDDLNLTPDQAVPLALLLTEAMTNAMKHAGPAQDSSGVELRVSLRRLEGARVQLVVENSSSPSAAPDGVSDGSGLGSQLIEAFARQLRGTLERMAEPDFYRLSLTFPLQTQTETEDAETIDAAAE